MSRTIPADRFRALIETACRVFIERGYQRTQMAAVASEMGLGKGTLYGYVESKEGLFYLALAHADDASWPAQFPFELPFPTPGKGALAELFATRLGAVRFPELEKALRTEHPDDPAAEVARVVGELFDILSANRVGVKLVNACSLDVPELGDSWHRLGRGVTLDRLANWLERRIQAAQLHPYEPQMAARLVLETVSSWAVHLHWDPRPIAHDPALARSTVLTLLTRGLVARPAVETR